MPTNAAPNSRFATMSAPQLELELVAMAARHAAEDAERRARHAAILASFGGR